MSTTPTGPKPALRSRTFWAMLLGTLLTILSTTGVSDLYLPTESEVDAIVTVVLYLIALYLRIRDNRPIQLW